MSIRLAFSTLRSKAAGFIGAFVALCCAAALVGACGVLLETGLRGGIPTERYAGSPIVVAGDQNIAATKEKNGKAKTKIKPLAEHLWIDASVADRVRSVPGVRQAVPELTFPASMVVHGKTTKGPSLGHSWESAAITPFSLRTGGPPSGAGDVVVDADLAKRSGVQVGSSVTIQSTSGTKQYRVSGIAAPPGADGLERQSTVFFAGDEARRLAGHDGQVRAVAVLPAAGVNIAAVRTQLVNTLSGTAAAKAYAGDDRGSLEFLDAARARLMLISMSGTLGATALLVSMLVVVTTFGLSIQQRHHELAVLRAVAATPRQVTRMIGWEALILGLLGGVAGSALSRPLSSWLRGRFVAAGAIPDTLKLAISPLPLIVAIASAVIAAFVAARVAARRISRIRPAEALTEAAVEPSRPGPARLVAGLIAAAGGTALTIELSGLHSEPAATPLTFLTTLVWVGAAALLGPLMVRVVTGMIAWPLRVLSPVSGYLAAANARANARRIAGIVTTLSLAVAITCTILFAQTTLAHAAEREARDGTAADYALLDDGPGVASGEVDVMRHLAGVAAVTEILHTEVRSLGLAKYTAQGVTPDHLAQTMDLDVREGSINALGNDTAALSTRAASRAGLRLGDQLRIRMGDGTLVSLKVIAIYARGLGFSDITLSHDLVTGHVDNPLDDTVLIKAKAGAVGVRAALAAIAGQVAGIQVTDPTGLRAQRASQQRANSNVALLAMGLIIAFTAIAVVNSLTIVTVDRHREFALLRLVGTTRRQVLRMIRWESLVVTVMALGLGTAISLLALSAFSRGMTHSAAPYVPPLRYLLVIASSAAVTFASADAAARVTLRADARDAMDSL